MTTLFSGSVVWPAAAFEESRFYDRSGALPGFGRGEPGDFSIVNAVLLRSLPFPTPTVW